jgi:hypothetical protein
MRRWADASLSAALVERYAHQRYFVRLNNLTPVDVYFGRGHTILELSRFRAAPGARLSHLPFESQWAFPA